MACHRAMTTGLYYMQVYLLVASCPCVLPSKACDECLSELALYLRDSEFESCFVGSAC